MIGTEQTDSDKLEPCTLEQALEHVPQEQRLDFLCTLLVVRTYFLKVLIATGIIPLEEATISAIESDDARFLTRRAAHLQKTRDPAEQLRYKLAGYAFDQEAQMELAGNSRALEAVKAIEQDAVARVDRTCNILGCTPAELHGLMLNHVPQGVIVDDVTFWAMMEMVPSTSNC